jgi:tetratricopeptide (TPR) repeat protein
MKKGPAIQGGQILRTIALLAIAACWFVVLWKLDVLIAIGQTLIVVAGAFSLHRLEDVAYFSRAQKVGLQATFWIAVFAMPVAYLLWSAIGFMGPLALIMGVLVAAGMWWKVNVYDQKACDALRRKASLLVEKGEYAEAEPVMKKALNLAMQLKANRDEVLAVGFRDLALLYTKLNRWPEAQEFCLRAITAMESQESPAWKHLPGALEVLARIYARQRNFASFEAILDKSYQLAAAQLGANAPEAAAKLIDYARLCDAENRPATALRFYQQSAAAIEEAIGNSAEPVAMCHHFAGQAAARSGQWPVAARQFEKAAETYGRIFGPGDAKVAPSVEALGETHLAMGATAQGLDQLVRALAIREDEVGPTHPVVGRLLTRTAECYLALNKTAEAGRDAQRSVQILERVNDPHQHAAIGLLARIKAQTGDILGAERLFSRAASQAKEAGTQPAQLASYLESRAELMQRLGQEAEAEALQAEIEQLRQTAVAA